MTKPLLNIQLALKRLVKPRIMPRPPSHQYNIQAKLSKQARYDIVDLHFEVPAPIAPWSDPNCFIRTLKVSEDKKELLWMVCNYLVAYLQTDNYKNMTYNISESYLYFCFSDENDKMMFATPHITSPLLFDPNDEEVLYRVGHCNTLRYGRAKAVEQTLLKRLDMNILQIEERRPVRGIERQAVNYTMSGIVNSLFNYYENKATQTSHSVELGSIYEDKKETGAILPGISSISTYEMRAFNYVGPEDKITY